MLETFGSRRFGRPRKCEARDTKKLILDAALQVFANEGFKNASMKAIAAMVGVRESSIYVHFENKKDILDALFASFLPFQNIEILDWSDDELSRRDLAATLRYVSENVNWYWTKPIFVKFARIVIAEQLMGGTTTPTPHQVVMERINRWLTRLFTIHIEKGTIAATSPECLALEISGPIIEILYLNLFSSPDAQKNISQKIEAQMEHAIRRLGL